MLSCARRTLTTCLAAEISKDVEKQIVASGIGLLTTSLVRELVNAKLIERGLEKERRLHGRSGISPL